MVGWNRVSGLEQVLEHGKAAACEKSWRLSPRRARALQLELAGCVRVERCNWGSRLVAGVDAGYSADGRDCVAAAVLWDIETGEVKEQHLARRRLSFPYIPGLLSFREAPAVLAALGKLRQRPDCLLCDGHGLAHPRRFGIACHLGVLCEVPSIGCAKSRLVGTHVEPGKERGAWVPLHVDGATLGVVLRTRACVRPVYVSVGHLTDLDTARELVLRCATGFRLPEPTRLADRLVSKRKNA